MNINQHEIKKACKLISGDMNLFLTNVQMVELLSSNPSLLDAVNDGALSGLFVPAKDNVLLIDFNDPYRYLLGRAPDVVHVSSLVPFIQKQIFNQFSVFLLSKPMPTSDELDDMDIDDANAIFLELQNAAMNKGYIYSSHPDGPLGEA